MRTFWRSLLRRLVLIATLWILCLSQGEGAAQEQLEPEPRASLEKAVQDTPRRAFCRDGFSDCVDSLLTFYEDRKWTFSWVSDQGMPTDQALAVLAALAAADRRGLRPKDYRLPPEAARFTGLDSGSELSLQEAARFDVALTAALLKFVADLHRGRIQPARIGFALDFEPRKENPAVLARDIPSCENVEKIFDGIEPPFATYRILKEKLDLYRSLAQEFASWQPLTVPPKPLKPGDPYEDTPRLARLLAALGDLPEEKQAEASQPVYGHALEAAVQLFQARHGLDPDGVLGKRTFAELNTPLQHRVRQIELALERWRWMPRDIPDTLIVVNIPAFLLRAYEIREGRAVRALSMKLIVGKEFTPTPLLAKSMRYIVFSPYWEVPPSIALKELLPKFARNPQYAVENGFVIEAAQGSLPLDASSFSLVRSGRARIRQKPGPQNALGAVKFMFPNEFNVYLHSTPTPSLFGRTERAFSHGCVRVERPVDLAEFALREHPSWNRERIEAAMASGTPLTVMLPRPIPVYFVYSTAVASEGGTVRFHRDLYGIDRRVFEALESERSS